MHGFNARSRKHKFTPALVPFLPSSRYHAIIGNLENVHMNEPHETVTGTNPGYLTGQVLIAMPAMTDPRFTKSVIYICVHNEEGAMGLVVNKTIESLAFPELLKQLDIGVHGMVDDRPIYHGGPLDTGRGFILHSLDYQQNSTISITEDLGLTSTIDVLSDIAENRGPAQSLLALGYAGWGPNQLDDEIQQNAWLQSSADRELIFNLQDDRKWECAISSIGIDLSLLSVETGHA